MYPSQKKIFFCEVRSSHKKRKKKKRYFKLDRDYSNLRSGSIFFSL